jgi:nitroreductase
LTPTGAHIAKAALAIAILMDAAKLPEIDGARAVQNMVLTAWAMGIGSGYPTEPKAKGKKIRKPLNEIVHSESLGQPFSTSKS